MGSSGRGRRGRVGLRVPEELPAAEIDEVRRVKVRLEEYVRASGKTGIEVKRGHGGIRDVEFAISCCRSCTAVATNASASPTPSVPSWSSRTRGTSAGTMRVRSRRRTGSSARSSIVCRSCTTCRRTRLPADTASRTVLARSLGLEGGEHSSPSTDGRPRWFEACTSGFYRPLLSRSPAPRPRPGRDREATQELLAGLGFGRPAASYEVLAGLVDPRRASGRCSPTSSPS